MKTLKIKPAYAGIILILVLILCCVPVAGDIFPYLPSVRMIPDKVTYFPGDPITYQFQEAFWEYWRYNNPQSQENITSIEISLDPHIKNITDNMPLYCRVAGQTVVCQADPLSPPSEFYPLWTVYSNNFSSFLPVIPSNPANAAIFTVSGKLSGDTPLNSFVRSSAEFNCTEKQVSTQCFYSYIYSGVGVYVSPYPEFPTILLPLAIIGVLIGAVFLTRRRKERS